MKIKRELQILSILPFTAVVVASVGIAYYAMRTELTGNNKALLELVNLQEKEVRKMQEALDNQSVVMGEQAKAIKTIVDNTTKQAEQSSSKVTQSAEQVTQSAQTITEAAKKVETTPPRVIVHHTTEVISDAESKRRQKAAEAYAKYQRDLAAWKAKYGGKHKKKAESP
jgi:uncharacterized protein YfcZ (UPF0381/DUF406 family)